MTTRCTVHKYHKPTSERLAELEKLKFVQFQCTAIFHHVFSRTNLDHYHVKRTRFSHNPADSKTASISKFGRHRSLSTGRFLVHCPIPWLRYVTPIRQYLRGSTNQEIKMWSRDITSCINLLQTGRISLLKVAENIITCLSWGVNLNISWTSFRISDIPQPLVSSNRKIAHIHTSKQYHSEKHADLALRRNDGTCLEEIIFIMYLLNTGNSIVCRGILQ